MMGLNLRAINDDSRFDVANEEDVLKQMEARLGGREIDGFCETGEAVWGSWG